MKLTLGNIRAGRIPTVLGVCSDDARLIDWANEAQERMMNCGRWFGTVARARFCITNDCLVWPREVAFIEGIKLCGQPISSHNMWYEFTEYVNPWCDSWTCSSNDPSLEERGLTPVVADITGTGKKVIVYARDATDSNTTKRILVQGRDENNQWIRMLFTEWVDGEWIVPLDTGRVSTKFFDGGITGIQKDDTNSNILMYQYDDATSTVEHLLGNYQPNEQNPQYRKSYLKNIGGGCCCNSCGCDDDDTKTVEAIVTLQHVPVAADTDWLLIQNEAAFKFAMLACKLEETEGNQDRAEIEFKKAIRELRRQHDKMFPVTQSRVVTAGHGTAHPAKLFRGFI